MNQIVAILLAAGSSGRFGSDKLAAALELEGVMSPLIVHSLGHWLAACEEVTVVVRPDSTLPALVAGMLPEQAVRVEWLTCPQAKLGMAASLAAGIAATAAADGWLVGLADMPAILPATIARVHEVVASGAELAAPFFRNKRGHPVGFGKSYRDELLRLTGDSGARQILQRDAAKLLRVEVNDTAILFDVDTPDDLSLNFA